MPKKQIPLLNASEEKPEKQTATTGTHAIHFEVPHEFFEVLEHCGRIAGHSPNHVAKEILTAWMLKTDRTLVQSENRIILPGLPLR